MQRFSKRFMATAVVALIAALLVPSMAMAVSGSLKLSGSTTLQPVIQKCASAFHSKYPSAKVTVAGGGSGVGVSDVIAGRVNIGMSSRALKSTETAKGAKATAVGRDALTIIVNPKNAVKNLTPNQVYKIYRGQITNWKQVGGKNAPIVACGRTAPSGTLEYFVEAFLAGGRQSSRVKTYASNGLVRSAVANNANAIGYVGMAYVSSSVRGESINGVPATRANADNGRYKYVRKLFLVTKGTPKGLSKTFIDYVLSTAGQKIMATEYLTLE